MPAQLVTRQLGTGGPRVPALGFGLMGLSAAYGSPGSDEERFKVLDCAYELGETFWDTADLYGDNEELVGKWFKKTGQRYNVFLATKFAYIYDWKTKEMSLRSDPTYVREACAKSLARLGVSYIDLYYCHRVDGVTPIEETVKAMVELKNEGKIRYLGLSEVSAETLRRAYKVHPIAAVQVEYSPFTTDIENPHIALLQACRELGVATVAYSPLGRGFLTGVYKSPSDFEEGDSRKMFPRFSEENFPKNLKLVQEIQAMAKRKGCTAGQLTLAWLMAQGEDIIPIPGTKKVKYLEENLEALNITLTAVEEAEIRKAVDAAEVHGTRYFEMDKHNLYGDTPALG